MQGLQKTFHHAGHPALVNVVLVDLQQRHLAPFEQRALALVCPDAFGLAVDERAVHLNRPGQGASAGPPERVVEDVDALALAAGFGRQQPFAAEVNAMPGQFARYHQLQGCDPEQAVFAHLLHDEHAPVLRQRDLVARAARLSRLARGTDRATLDRSPGVVLAQPALPAAGRAAHGDIRFELPACAVQAAAHLGAGVVDEGGDHGWPTLRISKTASPFDMMLLTRRRNGKYPLSINAGGHQLRPIPFARSSLRNRCFSSRVAMPFLVMTTTDFVPGYTTTKVSPVLKCSPRLNGAPRSSAQTSLSTVF